MSIYGYNNCWYPGGPVSEIPLCNKVHCAVRRMNIFSSVVFLCGILIVLPSSAQNLNQSPRPSPLSQATTAASDDEVLRKELLRIQREMNRIVQEMEAVDSGMT